MFTSRLSGGIRRNNCISIPVEKLKRDVVFTKAEFSFISIHA